MSIKSLSQLQKIIMGKRKRKRKMNYNWTSLRKCKKKRLKREPQF